MSDSRRLSYRSAVGHGLAYLLGQTLGKFRVGLSAERVVDRRERQAKGHEGGDGENLLVAEPGVAERLDVGGCRRVRVPGDLPGPCGHGLLLIRQPGVATSQNPR